jgi:hypothetical protein
MHWPARNGGATSSSTQEIRMMKEIHRRIAEAIQCLPVAFDQPYWTLARVSSKEVVVGELIHTFADDPEFDRIEFAVACGVETDSLILRNDVEEVCGVHVLKGHDPYANIDWNRVCYINS